MAVSLYHITPSITVFVPVAPLKGVVKEKRVCLKVLNLPTVEVQQIVPARLVQSWRSLHDSHKIWIQVNLKVAIR